MAGRRLIVGVAVGIGLAAAACSDAGPGPAAAPSTSSAASPSGSGLEPPAPGWTTGLDSRPTMAIAGPEGVYVTTSGSAKFAPQVYRLALYDGRQLAHRTAVGQPNDLLIAPDGQLWVAAERHIDQPTGTGVNVQDPESLIVVAQVALPDSPLSLARVGDTIWAGSRSQIFVLDPSTRAVTSTFEVAGPAYQLLVLDGGQVLVVEGDALEVLDPDGSSVVRVEIEAAGSITAAIDGNTVWVRVPVEIDSELRPYALPGLAAGVAAARLDAVSGGVAVASGSVWASDDRAGSLVCVAGDGTVAALPGDGALGVLGPLELPGSDVAGLLLSTAGGMELRAATCAG